MYVFKDMEDYHTRGGNVDKEYADFLATKKNIRKSASKSNSGLKGKKIKHKTYGMGTITKYDGTIITVVFISGGTKSLNYKLCVEKELIEFV